MIWAPSKFLVSAPWRESMTREVEGYVYRGLGLTIAIKGSPKGRRPPRWTLTHLGSGHAVCNLTGHVKDAFPIATEIAECGDWSFDGLYGWKNIDPELADKFRAIQAKHAKQVHRGQGGCDEASAVAVATARAV